MIKLKDKVNKTQIMNDLRNEITEQLKDSFEPELMINVYMIGAEMLFKKLRLPQVSNWAKKHDAEIEKDYQRRKKIAIKANNQ